jgi:acetoin utilization deacetylase AcuC-like enzyme
MVTTLITHPDCLQHQPPAGHPERPARLQSILGALEAPEFSRLIRREADLATVDDLARVHARNYVDQVLSMIPSSGVVHFDADTAASPGSRNASLRAAGAVVQAVTLVMCGDSDNVFCAVRPPGHHALSNRAMGFCLFNNVAVGAASARAGHGLSRVAVIDFDVHHGNGTEAMFLPDPNLFYASTHQYPFYPGTGGPGTARPAHIVDVPLAQDAGSAEFRRAYSETILPALDRFNPQLIFISAGFDAHRDDPLGQLTLTEDDYAWVTEQICDIARRRCFGRVVSTLEGGYDLGALARSTAAHVRALLASRS